MYSVIGYDKDNSVFEEYGDYEFLAYAIIRAKELSELLKKGELRREDNNEPIDWIEVYWNWNKNDEEFIWGSYDN